MKAGDGLPAINNSGLCQSGLRVSTCTQMNTLPACGHAIASCFLERANQTFPGVQPVSGLSDLATAGVSVACLHYITSHRMPEEAGTQTSQL